VAGDIILVTGPCGGSAAGLRALRSGSGGPEHGGALGAAYRRPTARLAEGEVARRAGAHAMIDVSDGLALDLHRMADASGVGFALDAVPVAEGATTEEALGGGEDYELVLTIGASGLPGLLAAFAGAGLREPTRLGVVGSTAADRTLRGRDLGRSGWQHRMA
jgi:thiamine-monophosphate kinase